MIQACEDWFCDITLFSVVSLSSGASTTRYGSRLRRRYKDVPKDYSFTSTERAERCRTVEYGLDQKSRSFYDSCTYFDLNLGRDVCDAFVRRRKVAWVQEKRKRAALAAEMKSRSGGGSSSSRSPSLTPTRRSSRLSSSSNSPRSRSSDGSNSTAPSPAKASSPG